MISGTMLPASDQALWAAGRAARLPTVLPAGPASRTDYPRPVRVTTAHPREGSFCASS